MRDKGILNLKILAILAVLVMVGSCGTMPSVGDMSESDRNSSSATIYVPDEYSTIQEAVNAASPRDTIIVREGTYIENIEVDKSLTIRSENGSDSTIVRAKDSDDHVFHVIADYVNIYGFSVEGASSKAGIYLKADYCNISDNNCSNNADGIYLRDSNKNSIFNNNCSSNNDEGIYLGHSNSNIILNNKCSNNRYGIYLFDSKNNKLKGNIMAENGIVILGYLLSHYIHEIDKNNKVNEKPVYYWKNIEGGIIPDGAGQIILVNCTNVAVENQNLKNASVGIQIAFSSDITIKNNKCSNNRDGISLCWNSNNNSISNNNCSNNKYGIFLYNSNNNSISNNNCLNNKGYGIDLGDSDNNTLSNNSCSNNRYDGIDLRYSDSNIMSNNNCSNNRCGIFLSYSNNNNISNNRYSNNSEDGIYLFWDSNNNSILNNNCSNNDDDGINLDFSNNNELKGNTMVGNGIVILGYSLSYYTHEIDKNNTVNGKPVYYWKDVEGGRIPDGAGQVILANCKNVVVENQNLNNASVGIQIAFSSFITIKNNICSNNSNGIYLLRSNNNTISNNNYSNNIEDGIHLRSSNNNNTIFNNNCSNNDRGIHLWNSNNNNTIFNNNCSNNDEGIYLVYSNNNSISNNNCSNNGDGIYLDFSNNNKLKGNIMLENGIVIEGYSLSDYTHEIDISNIVNGKPVYYWKDVEGGRITDGAGQLILVNCTNIAIKNQSLNNASVGIQIAFSSFITIKNNKCSNNRDGIHLWYSNKNSISNNNCSNNEDGIHLIFFSDNNSISNNNCSNNDEDGIYLEDSYNNVIHLNNFINKNDNVDSYNSHNIWNSTEKITYTYNETTYTNYLGNYWDDYNGTDTDKDGIGDAPHSINGDRDRYPLMELCEKYFALPMPGEWRGSAEFGEFVFIVNNNSTGISKISYNFSNWTCGPTTRSGGVSISYTPHWPITSGQFTIETDLGGILPMTIRGKFDETGTHASGNWEAVSSGVTCSSAWDADYNSNEKSNT